MKYFKYLCYVTFILLVSCIKDPAVISLISFNLRYDNPNDGVNAWSNRKSMVSDFVHSINPDIMGLQEVTHQQFLDIAAMFPEYSRSGVGRDDGKHKGEYAAILFKMDRFNLLEESTFWLSESPQDTGSISWGAQLPRIASWVRLEVKKTKQIFYVFNTHYSHISDSARINSSKLILTKIAEIADGYPVILTGDFNFPAGTEGYSIITNGMDERSGLADAQFKSNTPHFGGSATFNGFGKVKNGKKIDFIFVHPEIKVLQHGIYPIHDGDLYISDHYPVFTELEFLDVQVN